MPADPIDYRIIRNLQAALGQMTVGGGYHYDVAATAVKLDPDHDVEALKPPDGPRPFIVMAPADTRWEYQPANKIAHVLPVTIFWLHDSDPVADEALLLTYFRGCADIERAITVDITRGGLVTDTRILRQAMDRVEGSASVWAVTDVEMRTYRTYGQPN